MEEQELTKGKQQVQDEEVFLYKPYNIDSSRPKSLEPTFIQDKIKNLEKYMKLLQALVQTTMFNPPPFYRYL